MTDINSIAWHEDCLFNVKSSLSQKIKEFERIKEEVAKSEKEIAFYEEQIKSAKDMGKTHFDKYKFKVKKIGVGKNE